MDRNTIIGFVLIGIILVIFSVYNMPSQKEQAHQQHVQDSIAQVQLKNHIADSLKNLQPAISAHANSISSTDTSNKATPAFQNHSTTATFYTIENDLMKITLSSQGGKVASVELKKYKTWDKKPLVLFNPANTEFGYSFFIGSNQVNTDQLNFKADASSLVVNGNDSGSIHLRTEISKGKYIEQDYSLKGNSYFLQNEFELVGMDSLIPRNIQYINLIWQTKLNNVEESLADERVRSSIYFRYTNDEVDEISERSDGESKLENSVQWVSFKQHFFNSTLISKTPFESGDVKTVTDAASPYVKTMTANLSLPYNPGAQVNYPMEFYFGPSSYPDLKKYNIGLENVIPLGYGIFAWFAEPICKYFIIPVFYFLNKYISNYGIIILIMTVLLRVIMFPLMYKSFVSGAKMRVLKPEIDELKAKYKDDQQKFGQEQLKLFQQAGVNPLGGCFPVLLQLPIFAAMYSFFPISIELRQQPFLWSHDLSVYDSVIHWTTAIPFIGSHISLFALLFTATQLMMVVYTSQMSGMTGQMKWLQYIFPFLLFGVFNSLPAALNYYYVVSNLITFGIQFIIKNYFLDEASIHRQLQENKKKPKKRTGWLARMEDLAKQQQASKGKK
jgi:YidC/Oxa1 family membrane protein insertase